MLLFSDYENNILILLNFLLSPPSTPYLPYLPHPLYLPYPGRKPEA